MNFTEPIQVRFMDEGLDAVCLEDPAHASALEDLRLEEICLNDHHVSLVDPAHRGEGRILHDHPELPGEGQPEDSVVLFFDSRSGFGPCGDRFSWEPRSGLSGWSPCFTKTSPEFTFASGKNQGGPLLWAPRQLMGPVGLQCLIRTLTIYGASLAQEHSLPKQ